MATTNPIPPGTGASVKLDTNGNGLVDVEVPTLQTWAVNRLGVQVSSNTNEPTARVYVNVEAQSHFLSGTYTGSTDSSDEALTLLPGQHLLCRWTGGDPGATASLTVFGQVTQ